MTIAANQLVSRSAGDDGHATEPSAYAGPQRLTTACSKTSIPLCVSQALTIAAAHKCTGPRHYLEQSNLSVAFENEH